VSGIQNDGVFHVPPRSQICDTREVSIEARPLVAGSTHAERDVCTAYAHRLLHKVHAERLYVILAGQGDQKSKLTQIERYPGSLEAPLYVFHHQRRLANLRITDHSDFQDDPMSNDHGRSVFMRCDRWYSFQAEAKVSDSRLIRRLLLVRLMRLCSLVPVRLLSRSASTRLAMP
jgi:hypothetical protein